MCPIFSETFENKCINKMYLYHQELQCVFLKNKKIFLKIRKLTLRKYSCRIYRHSNFVICPINFLSRKKKCLFITLVWDPIPESHTTFSCLLYSSLIQNSPLVFPHLSKFEKHRPFLFFLNKECPSVWICLMIPCG